MKSTPLFLPTNGLLCHGCLTYLKIVLLYLAVDLSKSTHKATLSILRKDRSKLKRSVAEACGHPCLKAIPNKWLHHHY